MKYPGWQDHIGEFTGAFRTDRQRRHKIFVKFANGERPPMLRERSILAQGLSVEFGDLNGVSPRRLRVSLPPAAGRASPRGRFEAA